MDTGALKKFAQIARRQLLDEVSARMEQVLQTDSIEIREKQSAVKELHYQIKKSSKEAVIDQVAYTWFNRFCALRYMDVNHYTRIGVISPQDGYTQPEVLQEAKQGVIDSSFHVNKQQVFGLLNGQLPSSNPQQEAYRLLLVGACNSYHTKMPFLFPKIDDYTELLMPDDLLSENSILHAVRETLYEETCQDIEIIGWLYQFYISERKDEVFAGLKKNKKVEAEDIPAATQLFTPNWIVHYLLENSLGRLWMLNFPDSKLVDKMGFYIQPEEPETDFLEIASPEEIKVCDPACGSGHMLTYAFDLLYAIYEEQGYDTTNIPSLILQNNLFGIEIDQRAGHLAAFALMIKAREKDPRWFTRKIEPNIQVLENISFTPEEIENYKNAVGLDLFTQELWILLHQFKQAKNFGSLIRPQVSNPTQIRERLQELGVFNNLFLQITSEKINEILKYAEILHSQYQIIVANPPYMNSQGMNSDLKTFAMDNFPNSKTDSYSMFMERNLELVCNNGYVGMITIPNWMFLSSFEKFRRKLLDSSIITNFNHNGRGVWGSDFGSCSFILQKNKSKNYFGKYKRLFVNQGEVNSNARILEAFLNNDEFPFYKVSVDDLKKIPGMPIAYWIPNSIRDSFVNPPLSTAFESGGRCKTTNDDKYVRYWWEVEYKNIGLEKRWCLLYKGGAFQKYYGNKDYVFKWTQEARSFYSSVGGLTKEKYWGREGITWTIVTAKKVNSFRLKEDEAQYSSVSPTIFRTNTNVDLLSILGFLNSVVGNILQRTLNSTLATNVGNVLSTPFPNNLNLNGLRKNTSRLLAIAKLDWDSFEPSINFGFNQLIPQQQNQQSLRAKYKSLVSLWNSLTQEYNDLETDNNKISINSFSLNGIIDNAAKVGDITLAHNPYYRYGENKTEEKLESLYLADTMKEFISYAVGCMLGRYSLNKKGLILANSGETIQDFIHKVPERTFLPDEDNIIPVLEGEWFENDIAERFMDFLKASFGEENFEENLTYLEEAIGRDIRGYFVKDFYNEHVKMYKKRPIYWLFSSPKGSFNALIYIHRYTPDTISVILNDYLIPYRDKLQAHKSLLDTRVVSADASQGEKTKASREIDEINKVLSELKEYEDEILYPLATQQIELDLDDGVLVNYNKFGNALKKVPGLSGKT